MPGISSDDSQEEIDLVLGNTAGWVSLAVGGYSSGDYNTGADVAREYVTDSNHINMMNIDQVAGNYNGMFDQFELLISKVPL